MLDDIPNRYVTLHKAASAHRLVNLNVVVRPVAQQLDVLVANLLSFVT